MLLCPRWVRWIVDVVSDQPMPRCSLPEARVEMRDKLCKEGVLLFENSRMCGFEIRKRQLGDRNVFQSISRHSPRFERGACRNKQ